MTTFWPNLAVQSASGYALTTIATGNTPDPPDPPPDDTYAVSYDMRIFAGAIDEDTNNVLVVIDITLDDLKSSANGGEVLSNGNDIRFELDDGTGLGYYRKSWSASTGQLVALVAFPTVTAATDTDFRLKIGLAAAADQQTPALLGVGYLAIWDDDGTDLSGNGRSLTNSGTAPDTAFFSAAAYDGTDEQYTDAFGWLAGLEDVGIQILFRATAGMVGSNRGILAIGPDLTGAGSFWGIRYRPTSISSGDSQPIFFSVVTANGSNWVETPASTQSAGEHIIFANYGNGGASELNMILNGVPQTANVRQYVGGLTAAPAGRLYLGGGALDTDGGVRWQDRIGAAWIRASAYSTALAQFNTAMLWDSSGWTPWQIDTGSGYSTPTDRPEYAPVTPEDPSPDVPTLPTPGRTVNVSNVSQLAGALSSAAPGDLILLANGTYTGNFTASVNGNSSNPIVIKAANTGQAIVAGRWTLDGNSTWLWGIKIQDNGSNSGTINHINLRGLNQKLVGIEVDGWGSTSNYTKDTFIALNNAFNAEICYCKIANARVYKADNGTTYPQWRFAIRGNDHPAFCYQIHVHHCHFIGLPAKSNPAKYDSSQSDFIETAPTIPIPPGHSKQQDDWLIEYCLFENNAESTGGSTLDVKYGSWATLRYLTMKNCSGYFDLRSTEQAIVQHIWMDACGGMRVLGKDHTITDVKIFNGGTMQLLRGNAAVMDQTNYAQVQNATINCCQCTLQIGLQFSSVGTSYLPTGTVVNGHVGTVSIQSGTPTVTQNPGYSCAPSEAFELLPSQVGVLGMSA